MNVLERNNVHMLGTSGPVLLYAHGFGCNQTMWNRITPEFTATHRQVLFDYVGSGKSDLAAFDTKRYSCLKGYAQDVLEVCDALGLASDDVTFVGHSVSCSIGLLASITRPNLFKRLVLLGVNPCFLNDPPDYFGGFQRKDLEDLLSLMDQNYIGWANYLAPVLIGEASMGDLSGELSDSFCSTDPITARIFAQTTFFSDNRDDLPLVSPHCLILQHQRDALAPLSVGEFVHAKLQRSTLKILDVTGHCAHMSNPSLVVEVMRGYLDVPPLRQENSFAV
jgi:sigma-B regulation protein RsbQ